MLFKLGSCKYTGFPGYFVGEIVAINIRDFNISCLIDLGGYRMDLV